MKRFKFSNYTLTIFTALFLVLVSCEKDVQQDITVNDDLELYTETSLNTTDVINNVITESEAEGFKCAQPFEICGDYKVYPLIASQRYFAGALMVYNDADYLYVTYYSWYRLSDFHLFVGDVEALPVNGGNNPQIGLFPYKDGAAYGKRIKTFVIPINDVPDCYTIAAHAVLGRHTIWAKSCENPITFEELYGSKRWGWVIEDCTNECENTNVMVLKVRMVDKSDFSQVYGYINIGSDYSYEENVNWCSNLSIVTPTDGEIYPVQLEGEPNAIIANAEISIEDDQLIVTIETADANSYDMYFSYLYYGAEEDIPLNYTGCPDYKSFEYQQVERGTIHTYTIAL